MRFYVGTNIGKLHIGTSFGGGYSLGKTDKNFVWKSYNAYLLIAVMLIVPFFIVPPFAYLLGARNFLWWFWTAIILIQALCMGLWYYGKKEYDEEEARKKAKKKREEKQAEEEKSVRYDENGYLILNTPMSGDCVFCAHRDVCVNARNNAIIKCNHFLEIK